jgi:transcription initiation factor TFIIIB Brf1 subunit/transcription initiation factor TFIIB
MVALTSAIAGGLVRHGVHRFLATAILIVTTARRRPFTVDEISEARGVQKSHVRRVIEDLRRDWSVPLSYDESSHAWVLTGDVKSPLFGV